MTNLLPIMMEAARASGKSLIEDFQNLSALAVQKKGIADYVSDADRRSENIIRTQLLGAYPDYGFHGEESAAIRGKGEYIWHVDGLDGTVNFLRGIPLWNVAIGLERNGIMEAGVIYNPLANEMFSGQRDGGAFLNGKPIHVSKVYALQESVIALYTPGAKNPAQAEEVATILKQVMPAVGNLRRTGSVALDLAYVAAGRLDGFFELKTNAWDIAAGALLVTEAGGVVTGSSGTGGPLLEKSILASNAALHPKLAGLIAAGRQDFLRQPRPSASRSPTPLNS